MGLDCGRFVFGSCVTLTEIAEADLLPLLSETVSRIADHTIQDKITLGGNLAGTVMYREAALPFMIAESTAVILTASGLSEVPFLSVFDGRLRLKKGEILVRLTISKDVLGRPYVHVKKTRNEKIDYPLMTMCGLKINGVITAAVSGLANAPMVLPSDILSSRSIPSGERAARIRETVRSSIMTDILGSKEYREFVLGNILRRMYANFSES
jgi:CO/xanthine dehydrogenase FAD-binding subunit